MSRRVVLSADGLRVSKPGFDALTAGVGDMLLTPGDIMLRVYMKGIVAASAGSLQDISGVPATWNNRYRKITVNYGKTFSAPPIVLVAAIKDGTGECVHSYWAIVSGASFEGVQRTRFEPVIFGKSTTTALEIWTLLTASNFYYIVLENLI